MYVITAHQRHGRTDRQTDGRTSSDPMTAALLKHVAVKIKKKSHFLFKSHIFGFKSNFWIFKNFFPFFCQLLSH